jgi:hypothetical protein
MSDDEFKRLVAAEGRRLQKELAEWERRPLKRLRPANVSAQADAGKATTLDDWWDKEIAAGDKVADAEVKAKQLFQTIARDVGNATALRIFRDLGGFREFAASSRQSEAEQNNTLLEAFDSYGWPVQKLARHLAALNRLYGYAIYGTRFGHTAASIDRQLRRLLKKRGSNRAGKPGRPRKKPA